MNKLLQSIFLTTVVCSPLNLIGLTSPATAHHTFSHVSTVAIDAQLAKRKRRGKKRVTNVKSPSTDGMMKKKSPATTAPSDGAMKKKVPGTDAITTPDGAMKKKVPGTDAITTPDGAMKKKVPGTDVITTPDGAMKKKVPGTEVINRSESTPINSLPNSAKPSIPKTGDMTNVSDIKKKLPATPVSSPIPSVNIPGNLKPSLPTMPNGLPK